MGGIREGGPPPWGACRTTGGSIVWITYVPLPMCHSVMLITYLTPHHPRHTLPKVTFLMNKHIDFLMTINIVGGLVVSTILPIFVLWFSSYTELGRGGFQWSRESRLQPALYFFIRCLELSKVCCTFVLLWWSWLIPPLTLKDLTRLWRVSSLTVP